MKNLLKKYFEMDDEVRDDLELLYTYHELLSIMGDYSEIKLVTLNELEKIMQIIQKCRYTTNLSIDCIIENMLETLNCRDITIKDLDNLSLDELLEILFSKEDDEELESSENEFEELGSDDDNEVIADFTVENYHCIFCKNKDKYLVILIKGEDSNVIVLNNIDEVFNGTLIKKIMEIQKDE